MFHLKDGLYIERLHNGDVRIIYKEQFNQIAEPDRPVRILGEWIVPPNEFASFICNGSLDGEQYLQFYAAMQFLGVPGYENGWEQYQAEKSAHTQSNSLMEYEEKGDVG